MRALSLLIIIILTSCYNSPTDPVAEKTAYITIPDNMINSYTNYGQLLTISEHSISMYSNGLIYNISNDSNIIEFDTTNYGFSLQGTNYHLSMICDCGLKYTRIVGDVTNDGYYYTRGSYYDKPWY